MPRVYRPELSFVEWQECTCKVSIDTIHKTQILPLLSRWRWFKVIRALKVERELGTSPGCFCSPRGSEFLARRSLSSGLLGRVVWWSFVGRSRWNLTSAVSFVIAAEQGKQYVSTRTVRSVSWINSLLLKLFPLSQTRKNKMIVSRCWTLPIFRWRLLLEKGGYM